MIRICQVTGKKTIHGNKRSHAMNATKRVFIPNIHWHKFWITNKNRFVKLRVSSKGLRLIDKLGGIEYFQSKKKLKKLKILK